MPHAPSSDESRPEWFCIRSQPSRQNVAAAHLKSLGIEVFNPRIRIKKATRLGVLWRSEPLFANYLFARFVLGADERRVKYGFGVKDIVRFGESPRAVSESEIAGLRAQWGSEEEVVVERAVKAGETVNLSGRLFHGVEAEVLCLLPSQRRVKVLMDFLGGPLAVEVQASEVVPVSHPNSAADVEGRVA